MNLKDQIDSLRPEMQSKEAREQFAHAFLSSHIALQVKTLRQQREWTQEELAERCGKRQSQISAMERIDHDSWKISTLQQIASAFDLALSVQFMSYGKFLEESLRLDRGSLEQSSFDDDPAFKAQQARPGLFSASRCDLMSESRSD